MDLTKLLAVIYAFLHDARVLTILALIMLDVLLGVARAIREGKFDLAKLAQFYQTMVLPYVIGYLAFYLFAKLAVEELLGPVGYIASEGTVWITWVTLVLAIGKSALENARALGYQIEPPES